MKTKTFKVNAETADKLDRLRTTIKGKVTYNSIIEWLIENKEEEDLK